MRALLFLVLVACGHENGGVLNSDGGSITCGGAAGTQCSADEWCDFPEFACGASDATGTCMPRPTTCDKIFGLVCACDGEVHYNGCEAQAAGVDISDTLDNCSPTPGRFFCGPDAQCEIDSQFCRRSTAGPNELDTFGCASLPDSCEGAPSCACVFIPGSGPCSCLGDATAGVTLTCAG